MQGLKFNQLSAVYGNLKYTSNYLQYKSNYTRRHEHGKYSGPASSTSSSATRPAHLERGQVIWKIQKERLTQSHSHSCSFTSRLVILGGRQVIECRLALLPTRLEQAQLISVWKNTSSPENSKVKVKSSMARSLPVENQLPQNVSSIINYLQ